MKKNTLDQRLISVATEMFSAVDSKVSRSLREKLIAGDWLGVVSSTISPRDYVDARTFSEDYACVEFLRKCEFDIPGVNRRKKAVEAFYDNERKCAHTNARLDTYVRDFFPDGTNFFLPVLDEMRSWIRSVLGRVPRELALAKFGPGSTFSDKGHYITVPDKIANTPTLTSEVIDLLPMIRESAWMRSLCEESRKSAPEVVQGNRFTTVPKDALKDRGICIEPSINLYFQLGVGAYIKRRLFRAGIDLKNGQSLHRQWAQSASRNRDKATIDLSNASDTVCKKLVELLLPADWFQLLNCLRSAKTRINGKWVYLEKFSSMGNGFTFELETLIFAAVCFAMKSGTPHVDFHVFGDDIIVPTDKAYDVVALLRFLGFETNARKTFIDGPFRESCGGDFFNGVAVRPHYVKTNPTEPQHWISVANGIRRMVRENHWSDFAFSAYRSAWQLCLRALPRNIRRLRGPLELGDLVINDSTFRRRYRNGVGFVQVYRPVTKPIPLDHWKPSVVLAAALYGVPSRGVIPRDSVSGYKVGWVPFS